MSTRRLSAFLVLGLGLVSRVALAGDATLAESLFREGKQLMQAGDLAHACPKLAESYRQDPASGTLLALAYCQEQSGKTATAWGTYNSAELRARQEGRGDREQAAHDRAAALEPKLSKLLVEVAPEVASLPGFVLKRDGEVLPPAAWGSPMPVDPGEHVLDATAEGKRAWQAKVALGVEADLQQVVVSVLESAEPVAFPPPPAAPVTTAPAPPPTTPPAPQPVSATAAPTKESPLPLVGLITGGAGVVLLGVGAVFALQAKGLDSDSKADGHCTPAGGCDTAGHSLNQDALRAAGVATAMFVVGGVLVAGGATLYLLGGSAAAPQSAFVGVSPRVGRNGGGVLVQGAF